MLCISHLNAQDSIRLVTYNLLNYPDANPARISYLKVIMQYAKPDILLVNELNNETGANEVLVNALNTDGINYYSRAQFNNYDIQNNLLYYDTRKVGLLLSDTIDASPRPIYYFKVYLKDWDLTQTQDTTYLHLFSVHLKALASYDEKRYEATKKLRTFIDTELNGEHIFVGGDFNVIPDKVDVYDYKKYENDALFKLEIRKKFNELIKLGFSDIYRHFNKNKQEYTFWDYMAGSWQKNHGMRIDHFLVSNNLLNNIKSVKINIKPRSKIKPSDHTPIELEIN